MSKKNVPKPANKTKKQAESFRPISANNIYILGACLFFSGAIYLFGALHNQFTNWDDNLYVTQNPLIRTWSLALFTTLVDANWAPAHQLLLAAEYHLFGLNPIGYHITSILLHLCNVALAYFVALKLSRKYLVAGIVALFFGIHPMHVEAVAWVSAQKDLLFALFYLAAMLMYSFYQEQKQKSAYPGIMYLLFTMLFFILSCVSKGMGETLPATLVLMDCMRENNWTPKYIAASVARKIIFFLVSAVFGISAYLALKKGGALLAFHHTPVQQIMFVCYGFLLYVLKFFLPFSLSPLYLYPLKNTSGNFPFLFYISPIIVILLVASLFRLLIWRKKKGKSNNILLFGLSFFLVNIVLVLQLKPITAVLAAERYTYLSYLGFLLIAADALNNLWEKNQFKTRVMAVTGIVAIIFWIASTSYTAVWHDSVSLWTYAINNFPPYPMKNMSTAYINRGMAYKDMGKAELAIANYNEAIRVDPAYNLPYNDRGLAYAYLGKPELAIADYDTAISRDSKYFGAWYNRGLIYASYGKPELAMPDFNKALQLNPDYANGYNDRGRAYAKQGKTDLAIADYETAMRLEPWLVYPYYNRGLLYAKLGKPDLALSDYDKALSLNPQYVDVYSDRGRAYVKLGKPDLAMADYNTAINMNPRFVLAYYNRGLLYAARGETDLAIGDYNMAISLNPRYYNAYLDRAAAEEKQGNHALAQTDMQKAATLGWTPSK